jgi:hypothetical protein
VATPAIAHYGTTLPEEPPPPGVDQADAPFAGALAATDAFLTALGFERFHRNLYPGIGRQYFYRRGVLGDPAYVEKDTFTSYRAELPVPGAPPAVGDMIFRFPLPDVRAAVAATVGTGMATLMHDGGDRVLVTSPDLQCYELAPATDDPVENHAVVLWVFPDEVDDAASDFQKLFGFDAPEPPVDFHGLGTVTWLRRTRPAMTLGLLTSPAVVARPTEDIFVLAGYPHARLASPDKPAVQASALAREAFPDTGDVSYVYLRHGYWELIQA